MNEAFQPVVELALVFGVGGALGAIFFGGLWFTVQQCIHNTKPVVLLSVSFLLRTSVTLFGFYFVAGIHWQRWLACLLGFVLARAVVKHMTGGELRHAS